MAFIAPILPALEAIGTVVSVIGSFTQGQAQSSSDNYNAQIQQNNATIAAAQTTQNLDTQRRAAAASLGAIRASYGASGVSSDAGTPLDVLGNSAAQAELDKQNIIYNGQLQQQAYTNNAQLYRMGAQSASTASYFNAGSSLLTGSKNIYSAFSSKAGAPTSYVTNTAGSSFTSLGGG